MSIARGAIDRSLLTWLLMLGCLLGGLWGYLTIGRLEDPAFTIKTAVVVTQYPGASAAEVAREVTEPLESAIQQLAELDQVTSSNKPGISRISVDIADTYGGAELPQIWDKLRAEVSNAGASLPADARTPVVDDGFGDVYGLFYAVTMPGFTEPEIHDVADHLRRELLTVEGVSDVTLAGLPEEAIFVETDPAILSNLGVPPAAIAGAIADAFSVVPAGSVEQGGQRVRIDRPAGTDSVEEIAGLTIGVRGEVVDMTDFATVYRARTENPRMIVRHNGVEAFTLGIAGRQDLNIVDIGFRVEDRIDGLLDELPAGVEIAPIYEQHVVVEESSNDFIVNLATSVAIVIVVLALFMGWRAAVVVGATLFLTVVGTIFFMAIFSIEMERISLGALIIAMGMLVDNAIVVAEGMQGDMAKGKDSRAAAADVADKTQVPLLGATVIGIMAFAGIGLSPDSTGEFMFSLFAVIGISLLLSWLLAITVTPLLGHYMFKRGGAEAAGAYDGAMFRAYASLLRGAIAARWLVVAGLIGVTALCYWSFGQVKQQFFPDSNTPLFYVHYQLPQGSDIKAVSRDLATVEDWLLERDDVVAVDTFVGGGASRFMLTYSPEESLPAYGHLIIRTPTLDAIPTLRAEVEAFGRAAVPEGEFRTERLAFGPGGGAPIAVRFSGADPDVLRELAREAQERMRGASDQLQDLRTDWRNREIVIRPDYNDERAQTAGITREDVAEALEVATDGTRAGTYREDSRLIPIIVRMPGADEEGGDHLIDQPVFSESAGTFIPLEQLIDGFRYEVHDTLIQRRNRVPTITVEAGVPAGVNAAAVFGTIRGPVEEMSLPDGYAMEWGGEYENSTEAQGSLAAQLPLSLISMVLISILLFGRLRQPLVVWLLVPMSVNGVAIGLLATGLPFTFTALLGLLSLSGMLLKNGIVLVEEIDIYRRDGVPFTRAVVDASTSRVRPVVLAAATTILGMTPLLGDAFFASMAVTIMGGLGFASVLTLIAAPVFYYLMFPGARKAEAEGRADPDTQPQGAAEPA